MTPVKVALIGLGNMGQLHAKWLMRSEAFDLVAVADVDPARSAFIASDGIRHFTSGRSLLRSKSLRITITHRLVLWLLKKGFMCLSKSRFRSTSGMRCG